jgi:hypothetical protein
MGNDWRRRVGVSISGSLRHHVALSFRNVARTGDHRLSAQRSHAEQSERQKFPLHLLFPPDWNSIGRHHVRIDSLIPKALAASRSVKSAESWGMSALTRMLARL